MNQKTLGEDKIQATCGPKIEEYAAKVRGKGFHLDVLDAALFADNHDAMLHVAFDPFQVVNSNFSVVLSTSKKFLQHRS